MELRVPANPAVLATVRDDGSPHTVAVWFDWVEDRVLLNMDVNRKRLRYVEANPSASITILDGENWLRQLTVRGPISLEPDEGLVTVDRLGRPRPRLALGHLGLRLILLAFQALAEAAHRLAERAAELWQAFGSEDQ
jgi:PPOX class probable F420-dependent enzyme